MRIGENPLKSNIQNLLHKKHRIILPFWIPNIEEAYFKQQPEVLQRCLDSLTSTMDAQTTNITLINNHSCRAAAEVAESFVSKGLIDKYVVRSENRGKLEPILAEARASYEDFITIADADFLFFEGWESAVARVFSDFPKAGVVTCYPCPNLAFKHNTQWVLTAPWHTGKAVPQEEMDLVDKGLGHAAGQGIYTGKGVRKKSPWSSKQYYLQKGDHQVCLGAVHALATMKRDVFHQLPFQKIPFVFKNGYEETYLDYFSDHLGYYRLSTTHCYAYHMGNTLPDRLPSRRALPKDKVAFPDYRNRSVRLNRLKFACINPLVRLMRRLNWV
ncbi:glycosyltransferase family A protein [Geofilum rubicundum]|uniref:Glycosyltransferase 2-like domain-containing protein n=1 Tax=Geofilum rubicundum JCM 15548 TaxID=1236989 RepID=A0A0E9LUI5_9BACT|nr:glycosyltransferase family A protein [Geofilum rubicundum]GAO28515.1 hypothetical protein JCM15548_1621 [Geofilum rubicundum JCM 15548]